MLLVYFYTKLNFYTTEINVEKISLKIKYSDNSAEQMYNVQILIVYTVCT